ncbi:hypothetical protein BC941DRAFT_503852 [Chlamydoabsidia padenii]|nr:hypothetical protein BC941DRAFT_503852 [Chlamydoabsidia padenii]
MLCPTRVNKKLMMQGQHIVVEGSSCIITTTIDDIHSMSSPSTAPYTIITAAGANDLCALENLLYTLYDYRAHMVRFPRVVVYNLGKNEPILDQLHANGLIDDLIPWEEDERYHWKAAMMHEQAKQHGDKLVWMDPGNQPSLHFLYRVPSYLVHGFWAPRGPEFSTNCNEAVFGLDASNHTIVQSILDPWYQCGKDCAHGMNKWVGEAGHTCHLSARHYKIHTHRGIACRAMLMERDAQRLLYHPSVVDHGPSDLKAHWRITKKTPSFLHLQEEDSNDDE